MQGGPRSAGSVMTFGTALYPAGRIKFVQGFTGTVSAAFSASTKGDSATRFNLSQLNPDFVTAVNFLAGVFWERSVWSASTSCSNCRGVMLKENSASSNQPNTFRMVFLFFNLSAVSQKYSYLNFDVQPSEKRGKPHARADNPGVTSPRPTVPPRMLVKKEQVFPGAGNNLLQTK